MIEGESSPLLTKLATSAWVLEKCDINESDITPTLHNEKRKGQANPVPKALRF